MFIDNLIVVLAGFTILCTFFVGASILAWVYEWE
jgi:hypothetical protein